MAENDEKQDIHSTESLVEVAVLKCARHVVTNIRVTAEHRAVFTIAENPAVTPIDEIVAALYADNYLVHPFSFDRAKKDISQAMHTLLDAARGGKRSNDNERDEQQGSETPGA